MDATRGGEKGGKGEKKKREMSASQSSSSHWPDGFSRCWGTQVQLDGSVVKRGNKVEAPQGTGSEGMRLTPKMTLSHISTQKELAPLFWILLINTFIEALSIQGLIQGKNFLFPSHPPSLLLLSQSTFFLSLYSILPFPPFILSVFHFFFFSSVGSVWIRCLAVSMR